MEGQEDAPTLQINENPLLWEPGFWSGLNDELASAVFRVWYHWRLKEGSSLSAEAALTLLCRAFNISPPPRLQLLLDPVTNPTNLLRYLCILFTQIRGMHYRVC